MELNSQKKENFLNFFKKKYILCYFIVVVIFLLDRISKKKIIIYSDSVNQIFINDFLNLQLVWNTGVGFGLLSFEADIMYHLISFLIAIILCFIIFLMFKSAFNIKILFSLILGGALGNFYDRIVYYAVPDFIDIHYKDFHWFTFNVADIFITVGLILLIFSDFVKDKNKNENS
jgi:signal peptidase II